MDGQGRIRPPATAGAKSTGDELDALLAQAAEDERQEPTFPDRPIISIDAPTPATVDDAFFIEARPDGGWNLTLALACPAFRWPFGGEAGQGGLQPRHQHLSAEATHHMLPEASAREPTACWPKRRRPSLLIECTVGADGLVAACGEREFLLFRDRTGSTSTYTYRASTRRSTAPANVFLSMGVAAGERVAVQLCTCPSS